MEGSNIAVTAGHCVYSDVTDSGAYEDDIDNPRFPDKIEFYFGISNSSEISSSYPYYAEAKVLNIVIIYLPTLITIGQWLSWIAILDILLDGMVELRIGMIQVLP